MEYPHRRYLLYLLSRRMTPYEIAADCLAKALLVPNDEELAEIRQRLGPLPSCWRAELTRSNTKFYRWLRDRDIIDLWKQGRCMTLAIDFLFVGHVRKDFEALYLATADVGRARKELLFKYAERLVPAEDVLEVFVDTFWNLGEMSHQGIFEFLQANQDRQELVPAAMGDLAVTYGALGLRQRIEEEELYDEIIALAHSETRMARRLGLKKGAYLAGVAAVNRVAIDAAQIRRELHGEGAVDTLRQAAAAFRTRMIQADPIPSFDELVDEDDAGDVIDAEFVDADAGNVRQFPGG